MLDVIRRKSQSLGVKIVFGVIIIVFVFWGATAVGTRSTQNLAMVNGVGINGMDFSLEYRKQVESLRSVPGFSSLDNSQREDLGHYVLQQMISRELMRQEAEKLGLGTSDTELSYIVAKTPQFLDADGKFDPALYKIALGAVNLTPGLYERNVSNDVMEFKLRNYIGTSVYLGSEEAYQSFKFDFERRTVDYIFFPSSEYNLQVIPEEKEFADYYEANKDSFAIPPKADFDYLLFNPESVSGSLSFSDAELQNKEDIVFRRLEEIQQEVEDAIITKKDINALAQQYKINTQHTGLKDIEALAEGFGVKANIFSNIASVQPGTLLPLPIELDEGFIVLKLNAYAPGNIPPLESVRSEIADILRSRGALKLAMDDAGKVAKDIATANGVLPAKISHRLKESRPVDRINGFAELGFSPMLTQAIFNADPAKWVDDPLTTENGAVLIKVKDILPPSNSEWEGRRVDYTERLLNDRRNTLFNAYFGLIVKNSEIEFLVDKIFQD